ncbi:MAG: phosphoserine phosphatase [Methylobacteriaceae bacterium]|jgi:phosphoserine phosphatase|nr:phosphoserine phosphatase [Methylobacteriaceae bacterium]
MTHVATLVTPQDQPVLDQASIARAAVLLPNARAPDWLAPQIAADILFEPVSAIDSREVADRIRTALADLPVDVFVQPCAYRRKMLLLADMDSTMIRQECIDELADFVGLKKQVSAITERAMRGEIEFEPALRERVALLRGLEHNIVDRILDERIVLTSGGRTLVQTMRANGAHTVLVSGGFTLFAERIAAAIGFQEARANVLMIDGEFFAGTVNEPILGRQAKVATLIELRSKLGLDCAETLAIGDGANDLAMLEEAGLGVAYHAKPAVAAAAHARVDHGDLTALLYAQGYQHSDFTEGSSPG